MTYDPSDPYRHQMQPRFTPAAPGQSQPARPAQAWPDAPPPQTRPAAHGPRKLGLTAAEKFWYVLGCIAFGASYFAKIPAKKALEDFGLAELTGAESFWYILMCISFGAGYFAKIPTAKAVSELQQFRVADRPQLEYTSR